MKYLMIVCAAASFALAGWASMHIASDIQLIIVLIGAVGGMVFAGLSAVLVAIEERGGR